MSIQKCRRVGLRNSPLRIGPELGGFQRDCTKEGADVALTRHGEVVAVVSRPDRARMRRRFKLQAEAAALRAEMEAARHLPLPSTVGDPAWADRMVAELRADRDAD